MITKTIFICYLPINQRFIKDFYMDELSKNNFSVEYWDITNIYFSNKFEDKLDSKYVKKFYSYESFEVAIKQQNCENTIYFVHITYRGQVIKLYRILTKNNCRIAYMSRFVATSTKITALPLAIWLSRIKTLLIKIFSVRELFRFISDKLSVILKNNKYIKPYDIVFSVSKYGISTVGRGWKIELKKSMIIPINSRDYDNFLCHRNENNTVITNKKYCVFLDQYYPFHPDFIVTKAKKIIPPDYYPRINTFFDNVQKNLDIDVIIAAHPTAEKYMEHNYFNNRRVLFNKTLDLISHAEFVIAHNSNAVSYAVLFNKPLVFITNDIMKNVMQGTHFSIISFAKELNCPLLNIDNYSMDILYHLSYDSSIYEKYKYNYLCTKGTEYQNSFSIFLKTINSL
jgi:hypothetical protein